MTGDARADGMLIAFSCVLLGAACSGLLAGAIYLFLRAGEAVADTIGAIQKRRRRANEKAS